MFIGPVPHVATSGYTHRFTVQHACNSEIQRMTKDHNCLNKQVVALLSSGGGGENRTLRSGKRKTHIRAARRRKSTTKQHIRIVDDICWLTKANTSRTGPTHISTAGVCTKCVPENAAWRPSHSCRGMAHAPPKCTAQDPIAGSWQKV